METTLGIPSRTLQWAQRHTDRVIREHSHTFFWATAFLPSSRRRAIRSLYAFCRKTDDLVDRRNGGISEIDNWRNQVGLAAEEQKDPVLLAWAVTRAQYGVDRQLESELIDGIQMDIQPTTYHTWEDLARYCYLVASTVGLMAIPILGLAPGISFPQAAGYATTLGIALQLTNILRDVGEDAGRGRVYLPAEDMRTFGVTAQKIVDRRPEGGFHKLMQFEIRRARDLYRQALPGIRLLERTSRLAVGTAALLYRAILEEIERAEYDVFTRRAYTSPLRKILLMPGILQAVKAGPSPQQPGTG